MANEKLKIVKEKLRQFGLTSFAVDNRTSIFILTLMITLFGISSYNSMPKEAYPEIAIPNIFINTVYPGNSAEDIENLITRPIEKELGTISEIKNLESSSAQDFSIIIAEFNSDVDADDALRKVKDAVDKAKPELPNDLPSDPDISDFNFSEFPIMTVNISGEYPNEQLRNFAEYLQDEIEDLDEIKKVDIRGAQEKEIEVAVDIYKMMASKVNFDDIINAINRGNMTMSAGNLIST